VKKKILIYDVIFLLISLLSLLYIRYYEKILYYKPINQFLDVMYEYISIPSFYYCIAAFITVFIVNLLKINIPKRSKKILKYAIGLTLMLYVIFVFSNILGLIVIHYIAFFSFYSIIFAILGCLFSLTIEN